jgi:hypothetical protein
MSEALVPTPQLSENPEDVAAHHFKTFLPRYSSLIDKLSVRSLRRLSKSLVAYPLETLNHQHRKGDEEEALKLGEALMQSKFIMFVTNLNKMVAEEETKMQEQNKTTEQSSTVEIGNENSEGDANGKETNVSGTSL